MGKIVVMYNVILEVFDCGWFVMFIDVKGDFEDVDKFVVIVCSCGYCVCVLELWNFYSGIVL